MNEDRYRQTQEHMAVKWIVTDASVHTEKRQQEEIPAYTNIPAETVSQTHSPLMSPLT